MILSANMNRQHATLMTMLQTTNTSILLLQEPWWGRLVPKCSDTNKEGTKTKGTGSHPNWHTITPPWNTNSPDPRVAIFIWNDIMTTITYSILS